MNTFDKRYRVVSVESESGNPLHADVKASAFCCPAYFKIGERGWFLFMEDRGYDYFAHRIHTSIVKSAVYEGNRITVQTENTKYVFEVMDE